MLIGIQHALVKSSLMTKPAGAGLRLVSPNLAVKGSVAPVTESVHRTGDSIRPLFPLLRLASRGAYGAEHVGT